MQIELKWLPQAIALLDNIYEYYSEKSERSAIRIYNKLLDSSEPLKTFPYAGISNLYWKNTLRIFVPW
jgi:plasmid stabilization system protein ParE